MVVLVLRMSAASDFLDFFGLKSAFLNSRESPRESMLLALVFFSGLQERGLTPAPWKPAKNPLVRGALSCTGHSLSRIWVALQSLAT